MTSFQNSMMSRGLLVALLVGALAPFAVSAQEKPRSLVPSFIEKQTDKGPNGQLKKLKIPALRPSALEPMDKMVPLKPGGFVIQQLDAIHPGTIGLLTVETGGLGRNMWQGTSSELAVALIEQIKIPTHSPQMSDLFRRLLLTSAAMPDNSPAADKLLNVRLSQLVAAGLLDQARALLDRLPLNAQTAGRQKLVADLDLLEGLDTEACHVASRQEKGEGRDSYWDKLDIFCKVLADDFDRAELSAALLEERGEKDKLFFAIFAALAGDEIDHSVSEWRVTPLHFAMLRRVKGNFTSNLVTASGWEVQKSMMRMKERMGVNWLPTALNLAQVQGIKAEVFQENLQAPPAQTETKQPAYSALFVALKNATDNQDKATYLQALWSEAAQVGNLFAVSALTLPVLETLPVGDYGFSFNHKAVQLFLLHNKAAKAQEWERAFRRAVSQLTASERLEARKEIVKLDTYILLSGVKGIARWNGMSFSHWMETTAGDQNQAANATFILSMMEVFGYSVTEANWESLLYMAQPLRAANSNHSLENNLVVAAVQGYVGKTVALSLLALGTEGPDKVSLTTLRAVTSALKAVGLVREARQLALEVAILRGV